MMIKYNTLWHLFWGTIILSIIALYNGYPLVYSDTGTYIYSGFEKFIPLDRPVTYGLFLRYASLGLSGWFVILVQNFITAFVIFSTLHLFDIDRKFFSKAYYSILLFLVLFTGIGWYSNQLMPDFFAPLTILIFFILCKRKNLLDFQGIMLIFIFILSLTTHFSHLLIGSILIISTLVAKKNSTLLIDISLKRIIVVASIVLLSWFILPSINYLIEKKFVLSKGTHVFLMAHLDDTGILKKFLDEKCSETEFKDCKLCNYKDSLPTDLASFIWSGDVLNKSGGWIESKTEYDKIIKATLTNPGYLILNIYRSITYGLIQLTKNEIGEGLSAYVEGSPPYGQIYWRFNDERNNYLNSRQNHWNGVELNRDLVNTIHVMLLVISLFILILLFSGPLSEKIDKTQRMFLLFILFSIVLNSFVTAGLNSPCSRFQARVVWLLPFALLIIGVKNFSNIKQSYRSTFKQNG